ncbi:hypothetical protein TSUD_277450 [Trifolium subterraneum]|uniref:Reverse transcriptase domain-containing protein n=1 Tax=Trifolium subterraneum TaxID=3900 RepID=A0A2Z6N0U6_TRISU|nr:hypothetical protein TSUD_277450 [Trifolium subterraneum]
MNGPRKTEMVVGRQDDDGTVEMVVRFSIMGFSLSLNLNVKGVLIKVLNSGRGHGRSRIKDFVISVVTAVALRNTAVANSKRKKVSSSKASSRDTKGTSLTAGSGPSLKPIDSKDWKYWVALHGKEKEVEEDILEVGETIGVQCSNSFQVLDRGGGKGDSNMSGDRRMKEVRKGVTGRGSGNGCVMVGVGDGGIITMWDASAVDVWMSVTMSVTKNNVDFVLINVYALCDNRSRLFLWNEISGMIQRFSSVARCFRKFTWYRGDGLSMSRLDSFLLSEDWITSYPNCVQVALPRGCDDFVKVNWQSFQVFGWSGYVLKEKLKMIKEKLRTWDLNHTSNIDSKIQGAKYRLETLDVTEESRSLVDEEEAEMHLLTADILGFSKLQASMQWQKSRVAWLKEGDANSKKNHGIMSSRKRSNSIAFLNVDGVSVEGVVEVRQIVYQHFRNHFQKKLHNTDIDGLVFKSISALKGADLIKPFLMEEIKAAIWDCDSFKCPGPDAINLAFFKDFWEILKIDLLNFFTEFHHNGKITKGLNSTFIALIPKVESPQRVADFRPIALVSSVYKILSKVLENRLRHIVVDFEKAYDSVDWGYLEEVMLKMNFSGVWRNWIMECVTTATASVLVNGSPTDEFGFERGLRQGDLLSPFLFLLAAEGLHVMMSALVSNRLFTPFGFGPQNLVSVSHLQFADDTLLVGVQSWANVRTLKAVLILFQSISGLKVNFNKSMLFGINVHDSWLHEAASVMNYKHGKWVWRCMEDRESLWNEVMCAKYGQTGGRVKFEEGVGSIWWRTLNHIRSGWVWLTMGVAEIFGLGLGVGGEAWKWRQRLLAWEELVMECVDRLSYVLLQDSVLDRLPTKDSVHKRGVIDTPQLSCATTCGKFRGLGDVSKCSMIAFTVIWISVLYIIWKDRNRRIFTPVAGMLEMLAEKDHSSDRWQWQPDLDAGYTVRGAYHLLTEQEAVPLDAAAGLIWHSRVPLKVFVLAWRLLRDRLPTKANLVSRGILPSAAHLCVSGCGEVETARRLFNSCSTFGSLWSLVSSWIGSPFVTAQTLPDHFVQFTSSAGGSRARRSFMQLIWLACVWSERKVQQILYFICWIRSRHFLIGD